MENETLFCLDAGHGGGDPGAIGFRLNEKDINLKITIGIGEYLLAHYQGVKVMYTRTTDVFVELAERSAMANAAGANYFYSFHSNAYNGQARGYGDYTYTSTGEATKVMQQTINAAVHPTLVKHGIQNRGMHQENFSVLRETKMPALLFETLFIDNEADNNLLKDESFIKDIVAAYAKAIAKAAGLELKPEPPAEIPAPEPSFEIVYKVEVEKIIDAEAAIELLESLKAAGFEGSIKKEIYLK